MRWAWWVLAIGLTGNAEAYCFDQAARTFRVNVTALKALAYKESRWKQDSVRHNSNGTVDVGVMQINSRNFPDIERATGITPQELKQDACRNVMAGAWYYAKQVARFGNTWEAAGAYHSTTAKYRDPYARDVQVIVARLQWGERQRRQAMERAWQGVDS